MPSIDSRLGFLAVAAAGTLLVASTLAAVPQLRFAGVVVPTQSVVGAVAGVVTLAVAVSQYRGGEGRSALYFGLLGVGVPLALSDWSALAILGTGLVFLSVPIAWRVDERLRARLAEPQ